MPGLVAFLGGAKGWAALFVAGAVFGSAGTWRVMSWQAGHAETQKAKATTNQVIKQGEISYNVGALFEGQKAVIIEGLSVHLPEVHVYVTPETDRDFPLPCGFVSLFNNRWHGPVPDPAACPYGAPADTALSAVAEAETVNAAQYDLIASQLTALQDWVRQQQQAWPK